MRGGRRQREAKEPEQGRMVNEVLPQLRHVRELQVELDQAGGEERGVRGGSNAAVSVQVAFGKSVPSQRPQQIEIAHGDRRLLHESG